MMRQKLDMIIAIIIEVIGLLTQLFLVYLGITYLFLDDTEEVESLTLFLWCAIGTVFLMLTAIWLSIDLRVRRDDHSNLRQLVRAPLIRWVFTIVTFSSSIVGFTAAITLILLRGEPDHLMFSELIAVWAMLVSWALFHWGYSRIYYSRHYRDPENPPLLFPGTETPRQVDFAYFSFTNGTSFATSDVQVVDSRMRWTVVWHTTFSFFFNALIIVLTMNTISGGFQGV